MRYLIILLLLCPLALADTGYCTGQYVETGDDHVDGLVQRGDVFEYWCELPENVEGNEGFDLVIEYANARLAEHLLAPRVIFGTSVVIFP